MHSYNGDTHEDPVTIFYRSGCINQYCFKYKPHTQCWIVLPKQDADLMQDNGHVLDSVGIEFVNEDGMPCVEFHVDECQSFGDLCNATTDYDYDGNVSCLFVSVPKSVADGWKGRVMKLCWR